MLPNLDGLSIVRTARAARVRTPVLFLTAIGGVGDRVEGLEAGADDYLVKTFAFSELLARINALSRRPPVQEQRTVLRVVDLEMDVVKRLVTRTGQLIDLQLRETLDVSVQQTYSVLESTYASDDVEDLIGTMNSFARLSTDGSHIILLADRSGKVLSGNLTVAVVHEGFATASAPEFGLPGAERFRILSGTIDGYRLAVGQSFKETEDLAGIVLVSFGWASALAATMSAVSDGQLDVRIPLTGSRDDIDEIAGQINLALERLSTLVESMRQVSTDIAHDLKTPLNRLKLMIDEALDRSAMDEFLRPLLEEALAECDQINATFDALLRISQIEAGVRKLHFQPLAIDQLLLNVVETYADVAEDNRQSLTAGQIDGATIHGDKDLLTQMLVNLIENAITHCPAGTIIAVALGRDEQGFRLTVADNGPGIPKTSAKMCFAGYTGSTRAAAHPAVVLGSVSCGRLPTCTARWSAPMTIGPRQ